MAAPLSIFISYSRTNSAFVDRLEADLRARSFHTWVDRRKLEGGQDWMDELQTAIDRCQVLLVVLSPDAVGSKYVRMEYRYAQKLDKLVIPLEQQACPRVPIDLNGLQWVDFKQAYEQGLDNLMIALSSIERTTLPPPLPAAVQAAKVSTTTLVLETKEPEPPLVAPQPAQPLPDPDLTSLYRTGIVARAEGDLERVAVFWQRILERDPQFGNGVLTKQMKQLQEELHKFRVKHLRDQAEQAHQAGEWGKEIGAWRALLALEPLDQQAHEGILVAFRTQAKEAHQRGLWQEEIGFWQALLAQAPKDQQATQCITIAEHNQKHAWMYESAVQFVQEGLLKPAKLQLEMLWEEAPQYGDPNRLAEKVGLVPRLKQVYKGTYSGANWGTMQLTIDSQRGEQIDANGEFANNNVKYPLKGNISRDGQIFLKYVGSDPNLKMEFEGRLNSDGSIKGTFVSNGTNYTWEVA